MYKLIDMNVISFIIFIKFKNINLKKEYKDL